MKKQITLASIGLLSCLMYLISCQQNPKTNTANKEKSWFVSSDTEYAKPNTDLGYGASFDTSASKLLTDLIKNYKGEEMNDVVVEAKVESVCKVKGCWMQMVKGDGTTMRVKFKDYAFFVPRDINGKNAIFQGKLYMDTTSVAQLRHYAEDDGQKKEEIEKITVPEINMVFLANGVYIRK